MIHPAALLIQGDARHLPLADQSVQCVVSSPPYWGLRDYGLPPLVWDGDDECAHEWQWQTRPGQTGGHGEASTIQADRIEPMFGPVTSAFCLRCSAWRGSLGLEPTPDLYVQHLVEIFREVRRVLRDDGTVWLNLGDSYCGSWGNAGNRPELDGKAAVQRERETKYFHRKGYDEHREVPPTNKIVGLKPKDLIGIPWRVAFALQADVWWLRSAITWCKPACMPESVEDRPTSATEMIFLLTKSARYFYDGLAVRESASDSSLARIAQPTFDDQDGGPKDYGGNRSARKALENFARNPGRNMRNYWIINPEPFPESHFAVFPSQIARRAILAGTSERGACGLCGTPWERIIMAEAPDGRRAELGKRGEDGRPLMGDNMIQPGVRGSFNSGGQTLKRETVGWRPTCQCATEETRPCIVLDPFAGAGTAAMVAQNLGRVGVGIELKPDYLQMAAKRVRQGQLL